jgi:hypothetical protein
LYNFIISYVKGTKNTRADALSRKPEYHRNKTYESRAILREDGDSLVFNDDDDDDDDIYFRPVGPPEGY